MMRLARWQRLLVYGSLLVVALSGVLWFVLHDFIGDEPDAVQRLLLIVHGASAFAVLMAFGSLFPVHMRAGWLRRLNLATGLGLIGGMAVLIVTALVLYYGSEDSHLWARWLHIGVGLLGIAVFPVHIVRGYRARQNAPRPLAEPVNEPLSPADTRPRTAPALAFRRKTRITRALRRSWLGAERTAFFRALWRENR